MQQSVISVMREAALSQLCDRLQASGLPATAYTLADCDGYAALDAAATVVHCVEALLGPSPGCPGYSTYALAQLPFPAYPNLALTCLVSLRDGDRQPNPAPAKFSVAIDSKFSTLFLPAAFSAFNALDPSGQQRSLLVGSYSSEMLASDFWHASIYSYKVLQRFKRDGQLALIAVDYHDPYSRAIARVMKYFRRVIPDLHLLVQTPTPSALRIPVRAADGQHRFLIASSTALEEGFRIAFQYLDAHYRSPQNDRQNRHRQYP